LEKISLAPFQYVEIQEENVINDGTPGKQCGVNLTTHHDQNVVIVCISSGNIFNVNI